MRALVSGLQDLEDKLRAGGGAKKIEKQHKDGKLTARERIAKLIDPGTFFLETGLLIAYDKYDGQAPAAGVVTGLGHIEGRPSVIVANDATVKAGAWWPETIHKILRAQEIAMRNRLPIVYLVDSAGVNLPYQDGIFPGQYGAARIFYYNSLMRRRLHVPQIAAVMGMCIAGGAYLPALSDVIIMVRGVSFMGLGGPNLVKGAVGQVVDAESLGGASLHTKTSGVAHYSAKDDSACLALIRQLIRDTPAPLAVPKGVAPAKPADGLYDLMPADHRLPYNVEEVIARIVDADHWVEFQPGHAPEMLCATAHLHGRPIGVIANRRGFLKTPGGPRIGGIIYTEIRPQSRLFRRKRRAPESPPPVLPGRFRIHGRRRSRKRRHYPRRSRNGGSHGLRHRPQNHSDPEPRERSRVLRHGRPGVRPQLLLRLAHRPHRRHGRRFRRPGRPRTRTRSPQVRRRTRP